MNPMAPNFPRVIDSSLLSSALRFWAKVARGAADECWPWIGAIGRDGYGYFRLDGKPARVVKAHRLAWTLERGPIPHGMLVLHRCDYRRCCNLADLFLGTHADNTADMVAKGRARFANRRPVHA